MPIILNLVFYMKLMPKFGGFNLEFLASACWVCVGVSTVGIVLTCIGITEFDKAENFVGTNMKKEKLKIKDMVDVLKGNRPLQCYIASAASDKIAQQVASQSIINTMAAGIIIGDMAISTQLTTIGIIPSILFAFVSAGYARKHGNKKTVVDWTWYCLIVTLISFAFFTVIYVFWRYT